MPTQITSAGITFNDATSLTSANIAGSQIAANAIGATQIANGSVTASKLGTNEQKQICKAWVNFNGTTSPGTIRSSYNVSSVTKNGTGDYTVNFTTAMTDANYSVNIGLQSISNGAVISTQKTSTNPTTSNCSILTSGLNGATYDTPYVFVTIFGN